jgi:hypothetical protein
MKRKFLWFKDLNNNLLEKVKFKKHKFLEVIFIQTQLNQRDKVSEKENNFLTQAWIEVKIVEDHWEKVSEAVWLKKDFKGLL